MLKLYDFSSSTPLYWEVWEDRGKLVVHIGELGKRGSVRHVKIERGKQPEESMAALSAEYRAEGFRELAEDELHTFVIQLRLETWGSADDLKVRHQIEDLMNECLGWTGNGHCDGGDIGSGSMNIYCLVVDPQLAVKSASQALAENGLLDGAVMAACRGEDDFQVIYPDGFVGEFSTL